MTNPNYSSSVIHGEYYPHIDGIRALAVLPVVLFHILAILCPGGFAGVDVFFVISGYLITGGILRDLERDRFTIRNFYHRRIRRIMPAYFALIAGVFAAGCAIYYSTPLIHLGDASVMGTLFSANLYFWKMGGDYFAPDVHGNPLLHLWSLSVEEQFYLFIPLLCAIVWKIRRRAVMPVFATLATLSLAGAIYAVMTGRQNSAFYLLHFRAWELFAGSLLAMLPAITPNPNPRANPSPARQQGDALRNAESNHAHHAASMDSSFTVTSPPSPSGLGRAPSTPGHAILPNGASSSPTSSFPSASATSPLPSPRTSHPLLASLGLLMVLVPYATLSSKSPFPGAAAISPVLGTALLIRYGSSGWVSRLLAWRPFVATGKISYSLYLWHWPVTVFWKYAVYDQLYWYDYTGMFLLSLLLGYLSWKFVELPVRTSQKWTMQRCFTFAAAGIALLVSLGITCVFSRGWPTVLHPEANSLINDKPLFVESLIRNKIRRIKLAMGYNLPHDDFVSFKLGGGGNFHLGIPGEPEIFLIGDSHAGMLQYGLDIALREENRSGYVINRAATTIFNLQSPDCQNTLAELAQHPHASTVLLVQFWGNYDIPQTYARLEKFAAHLTAMGKTLFIATDIPIRKQAPNDIAARQRIIPPRKMEPEWHDGVQSEATHELLQGKINRKLADVGKKTGAVLVPLHLALKQGELYLAFDEQNGKTISLYQDRHHLSPDGSLRAARFIIPYIFPEPRTQNKAPQTTP